MTPFQQAFETSISLAEKIASARPDPTLRQRQALADFATFGLFKRAAMDPAALQSLQKGLGWGVGLGLPALGVGHILMNDAQHHSANILRDARNQALMTAAGVGGMQAFGELLKRPPHAQEHNVNVNMPPEPGLDPEQKLAAAIMVDDVLEALSDGNYDDGTKHAALVQLIQHRTDGTRLLRSLYA
jgi:hypothetical protein